MCTTETGRCATLTNVVNQEANLPDKKRNIGSFLSQATRRSPARIALYARVSTAAGHQDPEMQLRELREYAARRGWQVVGVYTDAGVSGARDSRPALNRLMADACRRKFDSVLVWKLDRF